MRMAVHINTRYWPALDQCPSVSLALHVSGSLNNKSNACQMVRRINFLYWCLEKVRQIRAMKVRAMSAKINNQNSTQSTAAICILFATSHCNSFFISEPAVKFLSTLEKINVKPHKNA